MSGAFISLTIRIRAGSVTAVDHLVGPGLADRKRDDLALGERPLALGGPQRHSPPSTISISSLPKW